ncbi:MAG TPA: cyclase family protein [Hyphomicrobiaceae bacterium]|nr:cyclase family protein [Hyphomicrobiaceae bacterium]
MQTRWSRRPEGSTWGDFGPDDQRGRLNLLTPEKVLQGIAEVREGRSYCLSLPLDLPGGNAVNPKRRPPKFAPVFERGEVYFNFEWRRHIDSDADVVSDDCVTLYSQYSTQWDSLAHVGSCFDADGDGVAEPVYYNGYRAHEHIGVEVGGLGARALGIENMAVTGVQGRAVLLDLHRHFGDERVVVGYDLLFRAMREDNIEIEPGDMFVIRTGWDDLILSMGGEPDARRLHSSKACRRRCTRRLRRCVSTSSGLRINERPPPASAALSSPSGPRRERSEAEFSE